jgi:hypothetical protein
MNQSMQRHSEAWVKFSYLSFAVSVVMMTGGLILAPIDLAMKGYIAMAAVMVIQTTVNLTKTMRDNHESDRLVNKIEDAKTERLLRDVESVQAA